MKLILLILTALLSFSATAQVNFHYQINVTVQCVSVTTDPTTGDLTCVQGTPVVPAGNLPVNMTCALSGTSGTAFASAVATCSPAATTFAWSVPTCVTTSAFCQSPVTPPATVISVVGSNSAGTSLSTSITLPTP